VYRDTGAPDSGRGGSALLLGALLFVSLLALFSTLVLAQATSEGTAKRALRRSVASLTEIDPLIDRNYDDLQQRAAVAAPGDRLTLRGFPVDVPLTPAEAKGISKADLRDLLLSRSADAMYAHGTSTLRAQTSGAGSVGLFSVAGITDHALDFLRGRNHDILRVLTFVLAAISIVCAAAFLMACRGFGRVTALGTVVAAAAMPVLLAGLALYGDMRLNDGSGDEYTQRQFAAIVRDLSWIAVRDGAALAGLGLALLALGLLFATWERASSKMPERAR
jgi:protein-S-isoprenylcysteine O-methyltransferase Ste14